MLSSRLGSLSAYRTETTPARIKLSSNELSIDFPQYVKERICRLVAELPINRYPDPSARELKEVIAQRFGTSPENLVLGNGSDELVYYLSMVVGEEGSGVFYPVPTFSMYGISAQVVGRKRLQVRLDENFDIDLETSLRLIKEEKPALAYFAYPNNPTGNTFNRQKMEAIREQGVFTVVDEAYYHYCGKTFLEDALRRDDTVVLRTLSKIGMAGLRVGVLVGRRELVKELEKVRLPFNITYPSQAIAVLLLRDYYHLIEEAVARVVQERERLFAELSKMELITPYPSEANFILFKSHVPASLLHKKLIEKGVLIRDFSYMEGLENCLRVSVGKPEENDAFLEALTQALREL